MSNVNAGTKTIQWLYDEHLRVDKEWSTRTETGFQWWADKHLQTVEIVGEEESFDGDTEYLISVRTEFVRSLELNDSFLRLINSRLMPLASMAGPVYDPEAKTLGLCSLVRVYEGIRGWMSPIIGLAAVLQIGEVKIFSDEMANLLKAESATSGHPKRGERRTPDELAGIIESLILPMGQKPCSWLESEFDHVVSEYMQEPPALLANPGGLGLAVEFPYGIDSSSICTMKGKNQHPVYGNGLSVKQIFPVSGITETQGVKLALSLNETQLTKSPAGYGFGSYFYKDKAIVFTCFFPNALYRPGLLPNIYRSCAFRARVMSIRLTEQDWTPESFNPNRSGLNRLLGLIGSNSPQTESKSSHRKDNPKSKWWHFWKS